MLDYRKVMNRSLSVVACQYWEKGEREALLNYCNGVFFAEPMFIFRSGEGVGVYYSWSDPRQDPDRSVEFFNADPAAFDPVRAEYLRLCDEIKTMTASEHVDLRALFDLLVAMWPGLVFATMLGKWDDTPLNPEVKQKCFDLRESTDKVFYDADAVLEKRIRETVGDAYAADAEFLTIEEILSKQYPSREELDQRKRGFVYFKGELYAPQSISDLVQSFGIEITEVVVEKTEMLKGQSASTGVVTGTVRVLFEKSHMEKVQKGDVVVAAMTTPDFMPAIRLAAALVTDEGGITCHAAITAREFGMPCVIGTKIATKTLHDGDTVEVDATKGVVTVISRA